jgi:hypothetical protein
MKKNFKMVYIWYSTQELVQYYGDYFRSVNFEFKPLLTKIFTEEYDKKTAGSKIKIR